MDELIIEELKKIAKLIEDINMQEAKKNAKIYQKKINEAYSRVYDLAMFLENEQEN